jgi:hypothetical protein
VDSPVDCRADFQVDCREDFRVRPPDWAATPAGCPDSSQGRHLGWAVSPVKLPVTRAGFRDRTPACPAAFLDKTPPGAPGPVAPGQAPGLAGAPGALAPAQPGPVASASATGSTLAHVPVV